MGILKPRPRPFSRAFLYLAAAALTLPFLVVHAHGDPPAAMAPPDPQTADDPAQPEAAADSSPDSVFDWTAVPQGQPVPIARAVFDQGGYQLYDTQGETIVIPFTGSNLYVMKFGPSSDDGFTFVNNGDAPILSVPPGGFLENASVPGARWYPFPEDYRPSNPVFLGVAPGWREFVAMGWYPDEYWRGGYWCQVNDGVFVPMRGLAFVVDGHPHYGWMGYQHYAALHHARYRMRVINRNAYHWAHRPLAMQHSFGLVRRTLPFSAHYANDRHPGGFHHTPDGAPRRPHSDLPFGHVPRVATGGRPAVRQPVPWTPHPRAFGQGPRPTVPIQTSQTQHVPDAQRQPEPVPMVYQGGYPPGRRESSTESQPSTNTSTFRRRSLPQSANGSVFGGRQGRFPRSPQPAMEGQPPDGPRADERHTFSGGRTPETRPSFGSGQPGEQPRTFGGDRPVREYRPVSNGPSYTENTPRASESNRGPSRDQTPRDSSRDKDSSKDKDRKH